MSTPDSEMLEELRQRAAEESPPALEGENIAAGDPPHDFGFDPQALTADTLELFLSMVAPNWLADSTPENIRITRDKIEKLSVPYFALLVKYLPGLFEKFPLEMAALVQTVMVAMPLVKADVPARLPKPEKKPDDKKTDAPSPPERT